MDLEAVKISDLNLIKDFEELIKYRTALILVDMITDGTEISINANKLSKVEIGEYSMKVFNELRETIEKIVTVDELAYITVKDEAEGFAFYKTDTKLFSLEEWQKFHRVDYKIIIKDAPPLDNLVSNKRYVAIEDVFKLNPPQKEFQVLNIHSIYLFPVIKEGKVVGIVDMAYIGKHYPIYKETLDTIQRLVDEYTENILATVAEYSKK